MEYVEIIITIVISLMGYVAMLYTVKTKVENVETSVKRLEDKQDKYNNLQERMAVTESSGRAAHKRLDEFGARSEKMYEILLRLDSKNTLSKR